MFLNVNSSRAQLTKESCENWCCFNFYLLSQSIDKDDSAQNHWFLIAQALKVGIFQEVASKEDICGQNGKSSIPPTPTPSSHYHYLQYTLPYPRNTIKRPRTLLCVSSFCLDFGVVGYLDFGAEVSVLNLLGCAIYVNLLNKEVLSFRQFEMKFCYSLLMIIQNNLKQKNVIQWNE